LREETNLAEVQANVLSSSFFSSSSPLLTESMLALTPRPPGILYTAATNEHQTAEYSVLERMINEQDCSLWRTFSKRPPGPEILQRRTFSLSQSPLSNRRYSIFLRVWFSYKYLFGMRIDCVSPIRPLRGIYKSAPRWRKSASDGSKTSCALPHRSRGLVSVGFH
jgi:hypothetical protein